MMFYGIGGKTLSHPLRPTRNWWIILRKIEKIGVATFQQAMDYATAHAK